MFYSFVTISVCCSLWCVWAAFTFTLTRSVAISDVFVSCANRFKELSKTGTEESAPKTNQSRTMVSKVIRYFAVTHLNQTIINDIYVTTIAKIFLFAMK